MKSGLLTSVAAAASVATLVASSAVPAAATPPHSRVPGAANVRSLVLDNGLTVIVWPDHDIPSVAFYNFVRVGSRNEVPGNTGLAHFFEHMMFNGTKRRAAGEFDAEMEARGGRNNASTSTDVTIYTDWFPREALETVFDLEADRLENLAFDPKVVESERGVVASERRLVVDDSNEGALIEQVQAAAFVVHPYQIPTIGWPADIAGWRIDDLQRFFRTYYAPNNCTIVIAGDVDPDEAFALAKRYFGRIPRNEPPPPVRTSEPEQHGERRVIVERRGTSPLLQFAYKAPAASDPRGPAVDLLASILTEGDSSRLHRALVEEQKVAVSVGTFWMEGFDPGLFWISLTLPQSGDTKLVERSLDAELDRLVREGVTEQELRRAKNLTATAFWQAFSTIDGKASLLGQYAVMHGDYRLLFAAPDRFESVTRDEVRDAARAIFDARRRTVGVLVPLAGDAADDDDGV